MQIPRALINALQQELARPIIGFQAISGGDINQAFRLETAQQSFFLKYNQYPSGAAMLYAESVGLQHLASKEVIPIPKPLAQGSAAGHHYLLLPDWSGYKAAHDFWERFGRSLAALHQHTDTSFGLFENNFIAKLPQSNTPHASWANFYWEERLVPMIRQAVDDQLIDSSSVRALEKIGNRRSVLFPEGAPSLLHGDLWSGNFMTSPNGQAGLIDPAIYYGHREMDLAMTRLFGGFEGAFYEAYQAVFPLDLGWADRVLLCQLYPLLVHLNLFGRSYLGAVKRVIKAYQ